MGKAILGEAFASSGAPSLFAVWRFEPTRYEYI